jgi:hypothetical protein
MGDYDFKQFHRTALIGSAGDPSWKHCLQCGAETPKRGYWVKYNGKRYCSSECQEKATKK